MTGHGPAATLWFLAPGLAHQLGNAVFTVHGRARLLAVAPASTGLEVAEAGSTADDARAILEGVERAQVGLSVLRWLCEDHADAHPLDRTLTALVEVGRVPVRDHGLQLELLADKEQPAVLIDPQPVARGLGAAFRAVAHALGGTHARLRLTCEVVDHAAHLSLRALPGEGQSALPPWAPQLAEALRSSLATGAGKGGDRGEATQPDVRWESADQGAVLVGIIPIAGATFRAS